jgi:hypothetical protein
MPSHHRHPWSDADYNTLSDMVCDGYPRKAIAARLGRSVDAVTGTARKVNLRIARPKTVQLSCQIAETAHAQLNAIARERRVTVATLTRLLLEISARTPVFITDVLDDADRHIEGEEAMPAPKRARAKVEVEPEPPAPLPLGLASFQPILDGLVAPFDLEARQ